MVERLSMKLLISSLLAIASAGVLVFGCGRTPNPAGPSVGGPNGFITWTPAGKDKPWPGIDQGSVYHLGTTFVLWSDAPGGGGGSSSSNAQGVQCQGSVLGREGRRIEFHCNTKDGKTGRVTINGADYNLADGNLFLVATEGDRIQVKQLKRSLGTLKFERETLEAFGKNDPDIAGFFAKLRN
jgi:hypothetical protein